MHHAPVAILSETLYGLLALLQEVPLGDGSTTLAQEATDAARPALEAWHQQPSARAGLIVLLSFLAAPIVDKVLVGTLRVFARRTKTTLDDQIATSLHGPIVKSVVLAGLWFACDELRAWTGDDVNWIHSLIYTLAVMVWLLAMLRISGLLLSALSRHPNRFVAVEERTLPLFDNLTKVGLFGVAMYLVIVAWDWNLTGWLASAGVAGIAIGFAAKDTLANLFAGVFIIADSPYHVGDYVVLDSGHRGRVLHIGLRSTRILTRDDVHITIPNSIIGNGAIVNETSGTPQYRIRVQVGVAYGSDVDLVRATLLEVAAGQEGLLRSPEPRVRFRTFGSSSLDFDLLVWIRDPELRGLMLDALNTAVYKQFAAAGVEIAFPQQDLHLRTVPEGWRTGPPGRD